MDSNIYYSGGFAELISGPTPLTYSFLKDWFTGRGSLGHAMKLLGLPYTGKDLHVLDFHDNELFVNLNSEEETLYSPTVLTYKKRDKGNELPKLEVSLKKLLSLTKLIETVKLLVTQARWIQNPENLVNLSEKLVNSIPAEFAAEDIFKEEALLRDNVWPNIIAIGYINEFYTQVLTQNLSGQRKIEVNQYVDTQASKEDWLFRSIADQSLVKQGLLSFDKYIKEYGLRADDDYELTCPRWYEITEIIEKRINNSSELPANSHGNFFDEKEKKYMNTLAKLRILRSLAKKRALLHINALRQAILIKTKGRKKLPLLTKEEIINGKFIPDRSQNTKPMKKSFFKEHTVKGKGMPISAGETWGVVLHIDQDTFEVPDNTIGIFPTSGPEYTTLFPKCKGIIFIKGSVTSHGAIVAREFGIPAIVDSYANPEDGYKMMLNATTGEWSVTG